MYAVELPSCQLRTVIQYGKMLRNKKVTDVGNAFT